MEKKRFEVFKDELWDDFKRAIFVLLDNTDPDNPVDVMGTLSTIDFAIADIRLGISKELMGEAFSEEKITQWASSVQVEDH